MSALSALCMAVSGAAAGAAVHFCAFLCVSGKRNGTPLWQKNAYVVSMLIMGAVSYVTALHWTEWPQFGLALTALLFAQFHALTDLAEGYIYDWAVVVSVVAAFILRFALGARQVVFHVAIGASVGWIPLALIILITRGGMGWGDANMMGGIGALLGWRMTLLALYGGFIAGGVAALIMLLSGKAERQDSLPLAPFLALGVAFSLFWGNYIWVRLNGAPLHF